MTDAKSKDFIDIGTKKIIISSTCIFTLENWKKLCKQNEDIFSLDQCAICIDIRPRLAFFLSSLKKGSQKSDIYGFHDFLTLLQFQIGL